ncbi:MAG: hypothetical protein WBA13_02365 [Microcoleaceae cyanobacterium]
MWISQVAKQLSLAVTGATLVTLGVFYQTDEAQAATLTITLPEYNFDGSPVFPNPQNQVGTFFYTLPSDEKIVSATIEGTFGNSILDSSAGVDVYLDNLRVAQCFEFDLCWSGPGRVSWGFTFDESDFSLLEDGMAMLTASQTSEFVARLGETTLTIQTAPDPPTSIPEATTTLGLLGAVCGLFSLRQGQN